MTTVESIAPKSLKPSPYNRRSASNGVGELVASIKKHGIIQPLIARRIGKKKTLELVAGERRLTAAKKLKLKSVPVIVRELSDEEALEALLEENLQRADLHPMDEAECFEQLRDDFGYTVEQLADRFGKTKGHIYKRLALLGLAKPVRKMYLDGELEHRAAAEIARVADQGVHAELAKTAIAELDGKWNWRRFQDDVGSFMLPLAEAPFDITDTKLVKKAGACASCPKRSGQQRELFDDIANADNLCLDKSCYEKKVDAWWKAKAATAKDEGIKVLSKAETKKAVNYGRVAYGSDYVERDTQIGEFVGDYKSKKKLKTVLKKDPPEPVLARDDQGRVFELYKRTDVAEKLKAAGLVTKAQATRTTTSTTAKQKAEKAKEKRAKEISRATTTAAINAACKAAVDAEPADIFNAIARLLCAGHAASDTAKARGLKTREALEAELAKMSNDVDYTRALALELVLRDSIWDSRLNPLAKKILVELGVDIAAENKKVRAEFAEKDKAAKAAAKKKKGSKKSKAKPRKKAPTKKTKGPARAR